MIEHKSLKLSGRYYELKKFMEDNALGASLPEHLKQYNAILDLAHDAWKVYGLAGVGAHSRKLNKCAKLVHLKFPELSVRTAKNYVFQAINLFRAENIIDKGHYKQIKLEELDKLLALAWEINDIEAARRIIHDQNELMGLFKDDDNELPDELFASRIKVFSVNIQDVGGIQVSRRELYDHAKLTYLDKLNPEEKKQIIDEIGITDVEFEEIKIEEKTERARKKHLNDED